MSNSKLGTEDREHRILDAAAVLIMRQGYDKTTMGDVADEVGVSRSIIYLHFDNRERLFEALIRREVTRYVQTWLEQIEVDPRGGTIGSIYRAVLYAINSRPFMAAIMKRDRRIVGNYLQKANNMFTSLQASSVGVDFLKALQEAGTVRKDADPIITSHIMDMLSYGLLTISDFRPLNELPPFDAVMETVADMLDRLLTPTDGGNCEAGKDVIRKLAATTQMQFKQNEQSSAK